MVRLKVLLAACMMAVLFIAGSSIVVQAQGTTPTVRPPDNIEAILAVLGIGAVVLIGFVYTVRANSGPDEDDGE